METPFNHSVVTSNSCLSSPISFLNSLHFLFLQENFISLYSLSSSLEYTYLEAVITASHLHTGHTIGHSS